MHPALSVILFTKLSGAGYGLMFVVGLGIAAGRWPVTPMHTAVPVVAGLVLATIGLLASLAHLGRPARAWRAFSQWRTSWLSREGIAAVLTNLPAIAIAALAVTGERWDAPALVRVLGAALALCCVATVYCTARIYSSLPTIRAWSHGLVAPVYLVLALYSGLLWAWTFGAWETRLAASVWDHLGLPPAVLGVAALAAMAGAVMKLRYWKAVDTDGPITAASATGLAGLGEVREFERPHTEESYLTREMGFVVARKHARELRVIVLLFAFAWPLAVIALATWQPRATVLLAPMALLGASIGIFVERWLFFAQARHVVMLYYGAARA
jgi:DMSO reductase anchor subunit